MVNIFVHVSLGIYVRIFSRIIPRSRISRSFTLTRDLNKNNQKTYLQMGCVSLPAYYQYIRVLINLYP